MWKEEFLELLDRDPAFREEVRRKLWTDDLLRLPERVAGLADQFREMVQVIGQVVALQRDTLDVVRRMSERLEAESRRVWEAIAENGRQIAALTTQVQDLAARVRDLTERMERVEVQIEALVVQMSRLHKDVGRLKGTVLELRWRERAPSYLGRFLRRVRVIPDADKTDLIDGALEAGRLTPEEADWLRPLDLLIQAVRDGQPVFVACEVSWTADPEDVQRAQRRSHLLRRALNAEVLPVVVAETADAEAVEEARRLGVAIFCDGREISAAWEARWR